ncbi:MAG: DUF2851 family protein [Mucinivorans sp.]
MIDRDFLRLVWHNRLFEARDLTFSDAVDRVVVSGGVASCEDEYRFDGVEFIDPVTHSTIRGTMRIDQLSSNLAPQNHDIAIHLVAQRDKIMLRDDREVLTVVLGVRAELLEFYRRMPIDCESSLAQIEGVVREALIERLATNRVERKGREILALQNELGDWVETFYISFMRSWGYRDKKRDFENLARAVPYRYIVRHAEREHLLEAMLLGAAGYLDVRSADYYTAELQNEWRAFRRENTFNDPIVDWQGARTRPSSAPAISIVRAATILAHTPDLMQMILRSRTVSDLYSILDVVLPSYWRYHSAPSSVICGQPVSDNLTNEKLNLVIINCVVPFLWAYGIDRGDGGYVERSMDLLNMVPAEHNLYTRSYASCGSRLVWATDSQAMIELKTVYCPSARCAVCPLGRARLASFVLVARTRGVF